MVSPFTRIVVPILFIVFFAARSFAAPTMAFGYLTNKSNNSNYDYLETIFPNSFASSIVNIFQVNVIRPAQAERLLARHDLSLKKEYPAHELLDLTDAVSADYFVDGSFLLLPNDRITISIRLYRSGMNRIFSFTNTGKMETEIFRLVDRITGIMVSFLGSENLFIAGAVPRGSRIGVITNIKGADLNTLYVSFLGGGYRLASIQGNSLDSGMSSEGIECFKYFAGRENSYDIVSNPHHPRFLHGTWTGNRYNETLGRIVEARRIYDTDYPGTRSDTMKKLAARNGIDTLLIVGFNGLRNRAWVRCLDLRTGDLLWMQSNIRGSVPAICATMIDRMTTVIEPR